MAKYEGDDVFLPPHLTAVARAQKQGKWAKPSQVWPPCGKEPALEPGGGRFSTSISIGMGFLVRQGPMATLEAG